MRLFFATIIKKLYLCEYRLINNYSYEAKNPPFIVTYGIVLCTIKSAES